MSRHDARAPRAAGRLFSAAMLAVVAVLVTPGVGVGQAPEQPAYVALGDSYTAAPLVSLPAGPIGCLRSTQNYPTIVARALGARGHRDVSCSGASTVHMTAPQPSGNAAGQLAALGDDVGLVTVGIGFNDTGMGRLLSGCSGGGPLQPHGRACREQFASGGRDALAESIKDTAPKIAAVLRDIHERAPAARVVVLGYPSIAPTDGRGCWPLVLLSEDDLGYLDDLLVKLNGMLAEQAAANDAEYADSYATSIGHDVCTAPAQKWWEGQVPTSLAYPWHPNAAGVKHLARSILNVLEQPRPAPVISALSAVRSRVTAGSKARFTYSLNRQANVKFAFQRQVKGRRMGGRCRSPRSATRAGTPCKRWSGVLRTVPVRARPGVGRLAVSARRLTTPGTYRVTASAAADARTGRAQIALFRITAKR